MRKHKDSMWPFEFIGTFLTRLRLFPYAPHMFPICLSVFIQRQDVLSWRHVASSFGEGPGMHRLHLHRWPPRLQAHHVSEPVSVPASNKIGG